MMAGKIELCFAIIVFLLVSAAEVLAKQVGFVAGINVYDHLDSRMQLQKAVNDADAVSARLEAIGFTVFRSTNASRRDFLRSWQGFLDAVRPGDVALFYFAGHGFEINGANYLLTRDVSLAEDGEEAIKGSSLRVGDLLDRLKEQRPQVSVFILDACRNNPFAGATRSIGSSRGLRREDPPSGTLLMMSAGAGQEALDSLTLDDRNPNSVYTRTLIPFLGEPGLEITDLAKRVRSEVESLAATVRHAQRPAFYHELSGDFFLVPGPAGTAGLRSGEAADAWAAIRSSPSQAVLEAYAREFPNTVYGALARARLDLIRREGSGAVASAAPTDAAGAAVPPKRQAEAAAVWSAIEDTADPEVIETFVRVYQGTTFAARGQARLGVLGTGTAGLTDVPPPSASRPVVSFRDCPRCPELVAVPAGRFLMGSPANEPGRSSREGPQHGVRIERSFAVGRFAVSQEEWDACVADHGCATDHSPPWRAGPRFPVVNVSYDDARAYVAWLSRTTGKPYRLLSEAEREYAARAGNQTPFWWGASISRQQANYDARVANALGPAGEGRGRALPVDFFTPNAFGLYQVHGNVSEWVEDCFHPSYEGAPRDGRPWEGKDCTQRVVRGGSWADGPHALRSASRAGMDPAVRSSTLGFRVARDL